MAVATNRLSYLLHTRRRSPRRVRWEGAGGTEFGARDLQLNRIAPSSIVTRLAKLVIISS